MSKTTALRNLARANAARMRTIAQARLAEVGEFHALTCTCGATFVVGPREVMSGRVLRCSACRGDAIRAACGDTYPYGQIPPRRVRQGWTETETAVLIQAYSGGIPYDCLPALTGHPEGSCATKVAQLIRDGLLEQRAARHPRMEPPAPWRAAA